MADYALAQHGDPATERERLRQISDYQDLPTIRRLEEIGVGTGWRCLDVGAGAGSIAAWLGSHVGPTGHVLATDLEIDALGAVAAGNVEVRRHDVRTEPLPAAAFDLVHARLLLIHLPERIAVLDAMVTAARPGGWVVVGDLDFHTVRPVRPTPEMDRVIAAFDPVVRAAGWDPGTGARLTAMFEESGLRDVEAESWQSYQRGGAVMPTILRMTYRRLRPVLLAGGRITEAELDEVDEWLADPANSLYGPTVWTAFGRRRVDP